jgi:hypothetical protein
MKRLILHTVAGGAALMLLLSGCATPYQAAGSMTGGTYGGIAGAILDSRNPWRGGVIGAALGALAGATIADVSVRGAREVVTVNRPVEYRTEDLRGHYYAEPLGYDDGRRCRKVREKVYADGMLVKTRVVLYCEQPAPPPPRYYYNRSHDRYERDDD